MVQVINDPTRGSILGRVGAGIGRGLADQLPKEIERGRLAEGLKQFEQQAGNLSPMQQLARLSAIPGITPQMIQSFGELGKLQSRRSAFQRRDQPVRDRQEEVSGVGDGPTKSIRDVKFAGGQAGQDQSNQRPGPEKDQPSYGGQGEPGIPWTQEKFDQEVIKELALDETATPEQAQERALARETRELSRPEAYQSRDKYIRQREADIEKELSSQLGTTLQKEGEEIYGDITGDTLLDLKENVRRKMTENPRANIKNIVRDEVKKAHNFVKQKNVLKEIGNRSLDEKIFPGKKEDALKRLQQVQKAYAEFGKEEEMYNELRSKGTEQNKGMDLSPGAAALVSWPRSERVKSEISNTKGPKGNSSSAIDEYSRQMAYKLSKVMTDKDSILAMAKELEGKGYYFNPIAFIDEFRLNQKRWSLTDRQKQDLSEFKDEFFPNWGDIALFPAFKKSVAND